MSAVKLAKTVVESSQNATILQLELGLTNTPATPFCLLGIYCFPNINYKFHWHKHDGMEDIDEIQVDGPRRSFQAAGHRM
jgi:hypothetical protein